MSTDSKPDRQGGAYSSVGACGACGARQRRESARYCATCGRSLKEDYLPGDYLRASYRYEHAPALDVEREAGAAQTRREQAATLRRNGNMRSKRRPVPAITTDEKATAATALAFVTYALVPYIGILFCPGAIVAGGVTLLRSYRAPHAALRRSAALAVALGLLVLCAQLLLWWILYKVPEWSRAADF